MLKSPFRVRAYVAATGGAGAATLALAAILGHAEVGGHIVGFVAFTTAIALTWARPLLIYRGGETESIQLDEALLVAMSLVLGGSEVIVGFALGVALGNFSRRRGMLKTIFNTGQATVSAGVAVGVMSLVGPQLGMGPGRVLASVAGAVGYMIAQNVLVSGIISIAEERPFESAFKEGLRIRMVVGAGNVSAGVLAGLAANAFEWSIVLAVVPVAMLQVIFANHIRAHQDRRRMLGLFDTAVSTHAAVTSKDAQEALLEAAKDLLRCAEAKMSQDPPVDGELGIKMPGDALGRWLIVAERGGVEGFEPADQALLEAVAAVGAGALEKARLFDAVSDERKKLAYVVDGSSDGIFSLDGHGKITSWNPAMEEISGYPAEEMVGTSHLGQLRPRDLAGEDVMIDTITRRHQAPAPDMQILRANGESRWISCTYSPMQDGGFVVVARDVTAAKEVEDLKSDFLATVSHELRTPLTPIQGFLKTLVQRGDILTSEQKTQFYEAMLSQSERLERLVNDLLQTVSLQENLSEVEEHEVDWAETIGSVVEILRSQYPHRVFQIDQRVPTALITADQLRAEQVLTNLLSNAHKYSPPEKPIEIRITREGPNVLTEVADRGPGIPLEAREKVFERFTRLGDHLTRKQGGVGLGLFICRKLVTSMGGRIWIEQNLGGGASFKFTLPASDVLRAQSTLRLVVPATHSESA